MPVLQLLSHANVFSIKSGALKTKAFIFACVLAIHVVLNTALTRAVAPYVPFA